MGEKEKVILFLLLLGNLSNFLIKDVHGGFVIILLIFLLSIFTTTSLLRVNKVSIILFIYLLVVLIPFSYKDLNHFWGNYISLWSSFVIILVFSKINYSENVSQYLVFLVALVNILIFFQLAFLYLNNGFLLKQNVEIPYGNSNSIASVILFCSVFFLFNKKTIVKGRFQLYLYKLNNICSFIALLLTQSSAAIALYICFVGINYTLKVKKGQQLILFINLLIVLSLFVPTLLDRNVVLDKMGLLSASQLEIVHRQNVTSSHGRLDAYYSGLLNFYEYPIFGAGLGNMKDYKNIFIDHYSFKSHNILIDLLGQSGIVGFLLYTSVLILIWFRLNRLRKDKYRNHTIFIGVFYAFNAVLLHGMVEPNFMSFKFDVFVFSFLGYGFSDLINKS